MSLDENPTEESSPEYVPTAADIDKKNEIQCHDIKNLLHLSTAADVGAKKELIKNTRRWVVNRVKQARQSFIAELECEADDGAKIIPKRCEVPDDKIIPIRHVVSNALAMLLRTLDDLDLANLEYLTLESTKNSNILFHLPPSETVSLPERKRRRTLPSSMRSIDIVQNMHDRGAFDSDEEDHTSSGLYLSNADRHQRAVRSHQVEDQPRRALWGNLVKSVMKVPSPKWEEDEEKIWEDDAKQSSKDDMISTMTTDAAVLRRDLYKYLAELDTADIKAIMKQNTSRSGKYDERLATKIKDLTSTLLGRITSNKGSPSMRLSAIIALDSLRELELSDRGYQCILDQLLEGNSLSHGSLEFYSEIVSECNAYEKPVLYFRALSQLMQQALRVQGMPHDLLTSAEMPAEMPVSLLLRSITHVMIRRQNVLSSLNKLSFGLVVRKEIESYNCVRKRISLCFDSVSNWTSSSMLQNEREGVISILQAEGVLSFLCNDDSEDDEGGSILTQSTQSEAKPPEYPYEQCMSLRAAHDRMGPCDGFNRLLSHPSSYKKEVALPDLPATECSDQTQQKKDISGPLSSLSDDVLNIIFSFLGYRSLARASQCCISWKRVGKAANLWAPLYFRKYKNRLLFAEELGLEIEDDTGHFGKFLSLRNVLQRCKLAVSEEGYDWNHIFKIKYGTERRYKAKTCNIVGCTYVYRRADHTRSHMRKHDSALCTLSKKHNSNMKLQMRVNKQHEQMGKLEKDLRIKALSATEVKQERLEINSPADVLKSLVFPYLDFKDLSKPICKLWTTMSESDQLWESLYKHRYGMPQEQWQTLSSMPTLINWKLLFRDNFVAKCNIRRPKINEFGWAVRICPKLGCNKELRNKLEYDMHVLKHEEEFYLNRISGLKKMKRTRKPRRKS